MLSNELIALQKKYQKCTDCPLSQEGRKAVVFGTGSIQSRFFFVGEAPGAHEDIEGKPFVGKAGQLLKKIIQETFPTETKYFLSNAVKCRPAKNRTPLPAEMLCCSNKILYKEIAIIKPKIIIALGKSAFFALTQKKISLNQARNETFLYQETPLIATFHPAFCLRFPKWTTELKKDLQRALNIF